MDVPFLQSWVDMSIKQVRVVRCSASSSRARASDHVVDLGCVVSTTTSACRRVVDCELPPSEDHLDHQDQSSETTVVVPRLRAAGVAGCRPSGTERSTFPLDLLRRDNVETGQLLQQGDWGSTRNSWLLPLRAVIRHYQLMVCCLRGPRHACLSVWCWRRSTDPSICFLKVPSIFILDCSK